MKTDMQLTTTKTTAACSAVPMITEMPSFAPIQTHSFPSKPRNNASMPHTHFLKAAISTQFTLDLRKRKPHYK